MALLAIERRRCRIGCALHALKACRDGVGGGLITTYPRGLIDSVLTAFRPPLQTIDWVRAKRLGDVWHRIGAALPAHRIADTPVQEGRSRIGRVLEFLRAGCGFQRVPFPIAKSRRWVVGLLNVAWA
jgi:hypothetical protein